MTTAVESTTTVEPATHHTEMSGRCTAMEAGVRTNRSRPGRVNAYRSAHTGVVVPIAVGIEPAIVDRRGIDESRRVESPSERAIQNTVTGNPGI